MLHYDADNILHCLIAGRKDWMFIHPFQKFRSDMASYDPGQVFVDVYVMILDRYYFVSYTLQQKTYLAMLVILGTVQRRIHKVKYLDMLHYF